MKENIGGTSTSKVPAQCPICRAVGSVRLRDSSYTTAYNKVTIELARVERFFCESCGDEFFDKRQSHLVSAQKKEAVRKRMGALGPDRIVALRRRLNLSQEELEDILGLGEKVVTRWETGRVVPGRTTDLLLRLLEHKPELLEDLRVIRSELGTVAAVF